MCDLRASVLLAEEVGAVLGSGAALQRGVPEGSGETGHTGVAVTTRTPSIPPRKRAACVSMFAAVLRFYGLHGNKVAAVVDSIRAEKSGG